MYRWYGDSGFYKTPALKILLVGMSACSFLYRVMSARGSPHVSPSPPPPCQWLWLLWTVRMWACPSAGVWLVAVLVLISCRPVERQCGSRKFATQLLSSCLAGVSLAAAAFLGGSYSNSPLPIPTGSLLHLAVGSLAYSYYRAVFPLHSYRPLGLPISSNCIFYLLAALFGCSSVHTSLLTACGMVGAVLTHWFGPLPLPSPPFWLATGASKLLEIEAPPPVLLSGATLDVQRQQQMDRLEQMMANMYQHRQRVIIHPHLRRTPPSPEQVAHLVAMGFPRNEAQQAMATTGNDLTAAIQLLTSRHNPT